MKFATEYGEVIINDHCPVEMRKYAMRAISHPARFNFKSLVLCDEYDDEVWSHCQQALDGMLEATPEELKLAETALKNRLHVEEVQELLK